MFASMCNLDYIIDNSVDSFIRKFDQFSNLVSKQEVTEIDWDDIDLTKSVCLGKGSFALVRSVSLYNIPGKVFALKELDVDYNLSVKCLLRAAMDITLEARLLSSLNHDHIIKLHATKRRTTCTSIVDKQFPFFLILDYLVETLDIRLQRWRREQSVLMKFKIRFLKENDKLMERVEQTALGIAKGMEYLHSKGGEYTLIFRFSVYPEVSFSQHISRSTVIFRDLKPENIGFDAIGTIKIFDFGIARDLEYVRCVNDQLGFSGTPRYMANEIMIGSKYGLPVDVYSFGILLYEVCTLKRPFPSIEAISDFRNDVAIRGERPISSIVRHSGLRSMTENCWCPIPDRRPTLAEIRAELESIIYEQEIKQVDEYCFNSFFPSALTFGRQGCRINTGTQSISKSIIEKIIN
jgi:serine/threonine protein kinase